MNLMQNLLEKIQPIVGLKSWDYSVLWKLSDDQSFLEWMGCCCAGTENINNSNGDQEDPFPPCASAFACRDVMLPHPRTKSCELLAQLPSSMPLDSGVHAQAFLSNQARWLNFSHNSDSNISQEVIGTRVLIPAPAALIELFVAKQVPEDQQVVDFITAQCNITLEQQTMINSGGTMDSSYSINMNAVHDKPFLGAEGNYQKDHHDLLGSPAVVKEKPDLSYDISADRTPLCNSPMNFLQSFNYSMENGNKSSMFFEEAHELNPLKANSLENGFQEMDSALQSQMMGNVGNNMHTHMMEPFPNKEDQGYGDLYKQDNGRSNSNSESDINDDEDDTKCRRRTGKGHQAKNLVAERKRRKKLNDRLYNLRALVPKITKLDRASILGDAIEYVKELQKQVEDLKNELEGQSDDEGARSPGTNGNQNNIQPDFLLHQRGNSRGLPRTEHEKLPNACHKGPTSNGVSDLSCQNHESENANHKVQQMEPQVQVGQLEGNEFFVKVFCEHKPGGFVRLMEALNSLGLEVTNVNATRHTCLVSNIFKVEIRDSEIVQADLVRDSLLELTRNSYRGWPEVAAKPLSSGNGTDHNHHQMYQNPTPFSHS